MVRKILWITFLLLSLDFICFELMVLTYMIGGKTLATAQFFYWVIKHVLGFPLSVVNGDYPFFLDSGQVPILVILFWSIINNMLLSLAFIGATRIFRKNNTVFKE